MKQTDFYYSTLYIYDKVLADALAEDFAKSGERSKSKYLADLIAAGLTAKQRTSPISAANTEEFSDRLSALERQISALQSSASLDQTEQATYRMLLCNVYYIDKGVQSTKAIDYLDYTDNGEKSSGVFGAEGLLTKSQKKALREKLRTSQSCI